MKYTKATNYALHIMAYMVRYDGSENISLQPLSSHLNMSQTYLSKILTQLVKADLIRSTPGVNGGYSLHKKKEDISFFDVIQAIEGIGALFTCETSGGEDECLLQKVMREAESRMESYLKDKMLYEVVQEIPAHGGCENAHKFTDKIAFLDSVQRRQTLPPEEILNTLAIKKTDSILDAGAGSGYLTIPAAKLVYDTVYALDMDTRMLGVIDTKAKDENISNIKLVQGSIDRIPLPNSTVDIVLASLILHEVRPLPKVLQEISRVLKADGNFLCLEYEKEESAINGPPMHLRIPSSDMEQDLIHAGFSIVKKVIPRESIYIMIAKKNG